MKATEFKCPKCGAIPTNDDFKFQLVEPATAYRRLYFVVDEAGKVAVITSGDVEYDDGEGGRMLSHLGCEEFPIPEGFWDYDIYG